MTLSTAPLNPTERSTQVTLSAFNPLLGAKVLEEVHIELGPERSYTIFIGESLLSRDEVWADLPKAHAALIVTNTTVGALYEEKLRQRLESQYKAVWSIRLPDGEEHKTWESLNLIFEKLLVCGADRKTVLFALGGGVVGDLTGFAAASFMRGVPFVQVPTTLLAQVDSSVGGKTAINHPLGKNMIGAFYQPERVICDLSLLNTLPSEELSAGLAEVIKYGPIADPLFLNWLEEHMDQLIKKDPRALGQCVKRSCEIKAWVVGLDERESGLREILNFGHTFGHAIESGLGFGKWLHGQAVAAGMVMASELSVLMGGVDKSFVERFKHLLTRANLPIVGPDLPAQTYLEHMRMDKKSVAGDIRFVLLSSEGRAHVTTAPEADVLAVLNQCTSPNAFGHPHA